jgi:gamma-glutamyltranspeptidase/glutathione hydrolase
LYSNGAVSSANKLASEIGVSVMQKGGNAIDAAIATAFALSVVEPHNSGLGGLGALATIYLKNENRVIVLNCGPKAPEEATPDMFVASSNIIGHKAVSIPVVLKGLSTLSANFGRLSFSECIEPSILLAEKGFSVDSALIKALKEPHLDIETKRVFQVGQLKEGDILKLPEYAQTLKLIRDSGEKVFYEGVISEAILDTIKEGGGILTKNDLVNYEAKIESPGHVKYYGLDVFFPLMYSGGPTMAQILKITEQFNISEMSQLDFTRILYKTMQRAFADRFRVLENPKHQREDVLELIKEDYCRHLAEQIKQNVQWDNEVKVSDDIGHTTHLCTCDSEGNIVSLTQTNGQLWFGSGVTVKGTGIVLNCGMSQYNTDPNHPNAPLPNRTNLSNMTPTIVIKDGQPFLAIGTPGSRRIITIVATALIRIIALGKSMKEALNCPRIHMEKDILLVEDTFDREILQILSKEVSVGYLSLGHFYGNTTGIQVLNGLYYPEVDGRFPGFSWGY